MAFDSSGLNDYIDVAQRIADFRAAHPHGSLQPADPAKPWEQAIVNGVDKQGKPFAATMIVYTAAAYRTPDDPRPGIGVAWEPFPGRTPYTLGSELMNAETSAWGRAIVAALASDSKRGVSSREEIRNRQAENGTPAANGHKPEAAPPPPDQNPEDQPGSATTGQVQGIQIAYRRLGIEREDRAKAIAASERLIGRALTGPNDSHTHKNLSYPEAIKLKGILAGFKTRAELDAALAKLAEAVTA